MRCRFCGCSNSEDEHRCQHCGRRLEAAAYPLEDSSAVPQPVAEPETAREEVRRPPRPPRQAPLFGDRAKVIPFKTLAPGRIAARTAPAARRAAPPPVRAPAASRAGQQSLDFRPHVPPQRLAAYGEAPVASPGLRLKAALLDAVLFAVGVACAAAAFHLMGGRFVPVQKALYGYAGALGTMLIFYHLFWSMLGRETAGMRCFRLRVLTFDGDVPTWRHRVARFAASCLGLLAVGLGLFWALVDEESLAWHDHISKTFPSVWDPHPSSFRRK